MKKFLMLALAGLIVIPFHANAVQTAQARLFCWSLKFQGSTTVDDYGFLTSMDLSTLPSGVNGELALDFFDSGYTHSTYIELDSELYGNGQGAMALDVPDGGDANGNSYPDFFEVSQPVFATTSGAFQSDFGSGSVNATWQRNAGSADGICTLRLHGTFLGDLVFTHSFQLIEYVGPLTYTPGSPTVSCNADLEQNGHPENTFRGPIQFTKLDPYPTDELQLEPTVWTNATMQTLSLHNNIDTFLRDTYLLTNYYGYIDFDDGDPNTGSPDFLTWMLSIDDLNDSNNNGIPDFSDDVQIIPPRQPMLTLTRGVSNLMLQISGDINHSYDIQQLGTLASTNWQTILSITLTTDPQTEVIPLPATNSFYRARVN